MNLTNQKLKQAIKLIQESIKSEDNITTDRPLYTFEKDNDEVKVIKNISENSQKVLDKLKQIQPNPKRNLTIELNENEQKSYDEFYEAHKGCQKYTGAIGVNNVMIIATGTSMGWMLECECSRCGEKKDITDLNSW